MTMTEETNAKARVFQIEGSDRFDLSSVDRYGVRTPLADRRLFTFDPNATAKALSDALDTARFDPELDWVCLSGNSVVGALLVTVLIRKYGVAPILFFNAKTSSYVERVLDLDEAGVPAL